MVHSIVGRGDLIEMGSFINALENKTIKSAALDVFDNEPTPSIHLLMHNAISMTPHIGAATLEAQDRIGIELADQIISFFEKLLSDFLLFFLNLHGVILKSQIYWWYGKKREF